MSEIPAQPGVPEYLQSNNILIIDTTDSCRFSILKTLVSMGANKSKITSTKNWDDAVNDVRSRKPEIIISEYAVEDKYGLDLLQMQLEYTPKSHEKLFILVTGNSSESSVAEAAEEDVDSYILKPFSEKRLVEYLRQAIRRKVSPTQYQITIDRGKESLRNEEYPQALEAFSEAKKLEPAPSLACYYTGQTEEKISDLKASLREYEQGLKFNSIHYKCLVGKFEVLDKLDHKQEAYATIKRLLQYFPVSPQRIGKIFRLAVHTHNFNDIRMYYDLYKNLERRSPHLATIVSAGLMVSGMFLLKNNRNDEALDLFQKSIISSGLSLQYLEKIMNILIDSEKYNEANEIFRMYPIEIREQPFYKRLDFILFNQSRTPDESVKQAQKLIKQGLKEYQVFIILINHLIDMTNLKVAESYAYKALQLFPDKRPELNELIEKIEKN